MMNYNKDMLGSALAAGGLGAAASIPVSMSSNQGLLQTIVNAVLAGGGSALGGVGGYNATGNNQIGALVGSVAGGALGQLGGNMLVTDRNEYGIANLAHIADGRDISNEGLAIQNQFLGSALNQAIDGLSDTKREALLEELQTAQELAKAKRNAVREPMREPLSEEEALRTEAIVQSILNDPRYVIT